MYADSDYYKNTYGGNVIPEAELIAQLQKASDQIDCLTYNRIFASGFEKLSSFQQDRIKKAVCVHADYIYQFGPYLNIPLSGYSAGSVSLSLNPVELGGVKTSEATISLLKATGLMDRRL